MTAPTRAPLDDDLEAYIDGRLDPTRRAEVEARLAADPKLSEMVQAMRFQNDALGHLGRDILKEPIPERLRAVVEAHRNAEKATGRRRVLLPSSPRRLAGLIVSAVLISLLQG